MIWKDNYVCFILIYILQITKSSILMHFFFKSEHFLLIRMQKITLIALFLSGSSLNNEDQMLTSFKLLKINLILTWLTCFPILKEGKQPSFNLAWLFLSYSHINSWLKHSLWQDFLMNVQSHDKHMVLIMIYLHFFSY